MDDTASQTPVMAWEARDVLLEHTSWLDYVREVYDVGPFLTYIGVNFTSQGIKNFKFYFSFLRALSEEEISVLLPVPDRGRFDELHATWHPTTRYSAMHRGTTFALKVGRDGTLTHYYHFRIPGLILGRPERLELAPSDENNYHGVCEEFTRGKSHLKRYWYAYDRATIAHTLEEGGLGDLVSELPTISMLEYIESEGRDKLEWVSPSRTLVHELIARRGPPRLLTSLALINRACRTDLFGPGSARDGSDHALYLIDTRSPLHPGGYIFDGVRTFVTEYLKLADPGAIRS